MREQLLLLEEQISTLKQIYLSKEQTDFMLFGEQILFKREKILLLMNIGRYIPLNLQN
jgi:hypothetical protein